MKPFFLTATTSAKCATLAAMFVATAGPASAGFLYDVRAKTTDKIQAVSGAARQGSFGSPAINDSGAVAYACVLSGSGIGTTRSYSIAYRAQSQSARPVILLQSGVTRLFGGSTSPATLNNNFLLKPKEKNVYPLNGSGYMFRIAKTVALNNQKMVAFAGEVGWTERSDTVSDNGTITNSTTRDRRTASYGAVTAGPSFFANGSWGGAGNNFFSDVGQLKNTVLTSYKDYFSDILLKTLSISAQNGTAYNAAFQIIGEEFIPGFAWTSPSNALVVATTASNAIGLPYFTTFQSFTDAVIADQNRCFVVADLSDAGDDFDGIWQGNNSDLQPVVVKGRTAPGTNGKLQSFDGTVGPSRNGKLVAFIANVQNGVVTRGVFRTNRAGEEGAFVAGVNGTAPGTNQKFTNFSLAATSNRGYVAFVATVPAQTGSTRERSGIWLSDPAGKNLRLVAIEGGTLPVAGVQKEVTRLAFNPVSGINEKGQVAFTASFSDRTSAVIVAK